MSARRFGAPVAPSRPRSVEVCGVIIHAMGEFIHNADRGAIHGSAFLPSIRLSAHAYVTPWGDILDQVPVERVALHAGDFNPGFLGVEVLVPGMHNLSTLYRQMATPWVGERQLASTIELVSSWLRRFDLTADDVYPHSALSSDKHDPGTGFPWEGFIAALRAEL